MILGNDKICHSFECNIFQVYFFIIDYTSLFDFVKIQLELISISILSNFPSHDFLL